MSVSTLVRSLLLVEPSFRWLAWKSASLLDATWVLFRVRRHPLRHADRPCQVRPPNQGMRSALPALKRQRVSATGGSRCYAIHHHFVKHVTLRAGAAAWLAYEPPSGTGEPTS
jgi:hypothetical protein